MTLEEYLEELSGTPLPQMDLERLGRLATFTPISPLALDDASRIEEAKRRIRDEIARRTAANARLEETAFRRVERHQADLHHGEHVAQSGRMHVAHMEQSHATFVLHRRFMWLAVAIAVVSALLAWASLWIQRNETREALDSLMLRLDSLEERNGGKGNQD